MQGRIMSFVNYGTADLFNIKNLRKEFEMPENVEKKKDRKVLMVDYVLFGEAIQSISDCINEPISKCCTLFGYSKNAHSEWKKNGKAPTVAFWAASGYLDFLRRQEIDKKEENENFSNEELREIVEFFVLNNGSIDIMIKAAKIRKEREE